MAKLRSLNTVKNGSPGQSAIKSNYLLQNFALGSLALATPGFIAGNAGASFEATQIKSYSQNIFYNFVNFLQLLTSKTVFTEKHLSLNLTSVRRSSYQTFIPLNQTLIFNTVNVKGVAMENQNLNTRLLDTAVKAMERNRTLLFTINLIAALVVVVVYLERYSFDMQQREAHLVVFQERCSKLNESVTKIYNWAELSEKERNEYCGCYDLDKIRSYLTVNQSQYSKKEIEENSRTLSKLYLIRNEMSSTKLDTANVSPLGFGLPVPRNDLIIISGILLLVLYTWLAFSFSQHARITEKIKLLFSENNVEENNPARTTINELIDLNFLFRTNDRSIVTFLVKVLYFSAPVSMTIATINEYHSDAPKTYNEYVQAILFFPRLIMIVITGILWIIGFIINHSDKKTNVEPAEGGTETVEITQTEIIPTTQET
jgi:hypothetical protein